MNEIAYNHPDILPSESTEVIAKPASPIKVVEAMVVQIDNDTPIEFIADVRNRIAFIKAEIKRIDKLCDDALIARINETGDIVIPGTTPADAVRLYVGTPPKHRIDDPAAAMVEIMDASEGDIEAVGGCLSSQWFKKSAIESLLESKGRGDRIKKIITTTYEDSLEEGKPKKEPKLIEETRFVREIKARKKASREQA